MRSSILSLALLSLLAGCAVLPDASPFRRDPEAWLPRSERVCVFELRSEVDFEGDDSSRLERLTQLLLAELRGRGFGVSPPAVTQAAWQRGVEELGAIFDPHSGRRDDARYEAGRLRGFRELGDTLACDVTLSPSLVQVVAPWAGPSLEWDGAALEWSGGYGTHGWVGALSLWVVVHDLQGEVLYFGTGGIEPAARFVAGRDFEPLRHSQLLRDDARTRAGLLRALEGFDRGR